MARKKNAVKTQTISLSMSPQTRALLQQIAESGLYGRNVAEVATRFLDDRIREVFTDEATRKLIEENRVIAKDQ